MQRKTIRFVVIICFFSLLFHGQKLGAQNVAVSTNALEWGFLSPNIEFALVTGEKSSVHLGAVYTNHPYKLDFGGFIVCPEYRYWFKGRPFSRMYIGAGADFASYDRSGKQGLAVVLGPTIGYDIVINSKWSIDLCAGVGGAFYRQREQEQSAASSDATTSGFTWSPVKAGINIVYIIK